MSVNFDCILLVRVALCGFGGLLVWCVYLTLVYGLCLNLFGVFGWIAFLLDCNYVLGCLHWWCLWFGLFWVHLFYL